MGLRVAAIQQLGIRFRKHRVDDGKRDCLFIPAHTRAPAFLLRIAEDTWCGNGDDSISRCGCGAEYGVGVMDLLSWVLSQLKLP